MEKLMLTGSLGRWAAGVVAVVGLSVFAVWGHAPTKSAGSQAASAGNRTSSTSPVPDLSGFWEIKDMTGHGLRGGALIGSPEPPALTAEARAAAETARKRQAAGNVVSDTSQYCRTLSYPFFMTSSPPFDIVQGPNEILMLAEREMGSRQIFLNQSHPDAAHLEPTNNGDAVGHWEGDTLVVDTIGFKAGAGAGGNRSAQAHLIERYHLFDQGKRLSVTFTWEDPAVYQKPYTYELGYYRSAPDAYAMEDWCDASDPLQKGSVVPPKQN